MSKWANGRTYKGQWKNGNPYGRGVYTYPDGRVYDGEFMNGVKHGQGKY